jgi:hypothetical protein
MQERKDAFLFVKNRLEENAPSTIEAFVEMLDGGVEHGPPYLDVKRRRFCRSVHDPLLDVSGVSPAAEGA